MTIETVGVDIAKNVFQLHGVNCNGRDAHTDFAPFSSYLQAFDVLMSISQPAHM